MGSSASMVFVLCSSIVTQFGLLLVYLVLRILLCLICSALVMCVISVFLIGFECSSGGVVNVSLVSVCWIGMSFVLHFCMSTFFVMFDCFSYVW